MVRLRHFAGSAVAVTNAQMRHLLRVLRQPQIAAADPLGAMLCQTLGVETPLQAVRQLVWIAFAQYGRTGVKLAELIQKSDIEGRLSQTGVAHELGYSPRQYFRYRSQAVDILTTEAQRLLQNRNVPLHSLQALADGATITRPSVAATLYGLLDYHKNERYFLNRLSALVDAGECIDDTTIATCPPALRARALAIAARGWHMNGEHARAAAALEGLHPLEPDVLLIKALRCRESGKPHDLLRIVDSARAVNWNTDMQLRLMTLEAEAHMRLGALDRASEVMGVAQRLAIGANNLRELARITLLSAERALLQDEANTAEQLSAGAHFILQDYAQDAALCQITMARVALALGKPWEKPPVCQSRLPQAWDRVALDVLETRFLLRDARFDEACERATSILEIAEAQGYIGIAAYASTTIATCFGIKRDEKQEQQFYIKALRHFLETHDRILGADLFQVPSLRPKTFGPLLLDDDLFVTLTGLLKVPNGDEWRALLSEILAYANGNVSSAAWIQKIAAAMRIEFDYDAIDAIGLTLAALLPRERRSKWAMSWLEAFSDIAGLCHKKGPGQ
jgi:hypothetical protein